MWPLARASVDALAGPTGSDPGTDLLDRTGELLAGRRGQRWHETVCAGANQNLRHAHANCVCPNQDFTGFWFGNGHIETLQHIRRARLAELDELHASILGTASDTLPRE